jgi:hypothetical protein
MIQELEDHDGGVSDAALMSLVGSAFDEGRRGREAQDVLARGRQLRRRKRAVPALGVLGVVAASVSLALTLTGPRGAGGADGAGGTTSAEPGHSLSTDAAVLNVDNAAFSVHTDAKTGKVTVTIRQFKDEDELKQILATAGIRTDFVSVHLSKLRYGAQVPCRWTGATTLNDPEVFGDFGDSITIDPSKMPSGSVLAFQYFDVADKPTGLFPPITLLSGEPTGCIPNPGL